MGNPFAAGPASRIAWSWLVSIVFLVTIQLGYAEDEKPETRQALASAITSTGDEQARIIDGLAETGSPLVRQILVSWPRGEIFLYTDPAGTIIPVTLDADQDGAGKAKAKRIDTGVWLTDAAGQPLTFTSQELKLAETDSKLRKLIRNTLDLLTLADPQPANRVSAVMKLGLAQKPANLAVLEARVDKEKDKKVQKALAEAIALIQLKNTDPKIQAAAVSKLADLHSISSLDIVKGVAADKTADPAVTAAATAAVKSINGYIQVVNFFGTIFRGISLGSILLVVALGLAITFGLMGVINMAHGEIMAIGAYTVYVVENVFGRGLDLSPFGMRISIPGLNATGAFYESYFLFSLPIAFLVAAVVGILLERGVIQFLYKRPLESLLATWGVSQVLQQLYRLIFGAANVQVNSPRWLSGNFTFSDVIFGYNRLFVIAFAALIVFGTWLLLTKTPLGLLIRAVMQNRSMASCMGVRTERVNMLTFGFGSGLAGLAGAFLSQIGNVGPSLGQNYIVDCFMTVVLGGVGSIFGTVCSAIGIGVVDQSLQQILLNPVMGKIIVLAAIILFLQWRPAGIFVTKSRSLEG
ncbi:MAG TPA: urea ABC transporter permease subunit UrtB [Chthoniobacterales bacterium]